MCATPTLIFDQITQTGDGRLLLDAFSLTIDHGEWFCLLGKSGVGKSTLARIGAGLLSPHGGRVQRIGESGIGFLAQSPGDLFIGTTVFEEVAFGLRMQGQSDACIHDRVTETLELVGLSQVNPGTNPTELSGGQQQLLALAAVLAPQPSILILDEPTSMLDPETQLAVLRILLNVAQRGSSILHITHDAYEALWVNRVGILSQGRLVGVGLPTTVLSDTALLSLAGAEPPELFRFWLALGRKGIHLDVREWSVRGMQEALLGYHSIPCMYERT
jgi:energy-coupling factor transporter ATP-binding protein EcfA2